MRPQKNVTATREKEYIMQIKRNLDRSFKHPLTEIATIAFKNRPNQDITTMSLFLAGAEHVQGSIEGMSVDQAYRIVAEDVLLCLEEKGIIKKDNRGWYQLTSQSG
jgi:hypothetical protein